MWALTRHFTRQRNRHYITIKRWGPQITRRLVTHGRAGLVVWLTAGTQSAQSSVCGWTGNDNNKRSPFALWARRKQPKCWSYDSVPHRNQSKTTLTPLPTTPHHFPGSLCHSWRDSTDQGRLWLNWASLQVWRGRQAPLHPWHGAPSQGERLSNGGVTWSRAGKEWEQPWRLNHSCGMEAGRHTNVSGGKICREMRGWGDSG